MKLFMTALSILSLVTTTTFAADAKIYPGSMGVRWNATDPVPELNTSSIQNPSSSRWLRLDLPVIHDSLGRPIRAGWVKVLDRHYSQNVRCTLVSVFRSGGSFSGWTSPTRSSSGSGNSPQTLYFPAQASNSQCHYYFSCHVPRTYGGNRSAIVSYVVDERT